MATGLFVGLVTLDLIYLTATLPNPNQKLVALDYSLAAGGPATNAAIAFQHLSNSARLMGVIGCHLVSRFVLAELEEYQIEILDLQSQSQAPLPTSSILVTQATGERAVVSINAVRTQAQPEQIPTKALEGVDIVLIDGHQMSVGYAIAERARAQGIPVVVDGGSWKPDFEQVLSQATHVICSEQFYPPNCQTQIEVMDYLQSLGIPQVAITNGSQPILWRSQNQSSSSGELAVPQIKPVDTLGAGDIFHGAFCHFILRFDFQTALGRAAQVAARACQSFGTRQWMEP
jgi:sugar/nucleoside kinase (ribokinase family)